MTDLAAVVIRAPSPSDEAEWLGAMRAGRHLHRPWVHPALTPSAFQAYLEGADDPRRSCYLVRRSQDGALAGFVNLGEIIRRPRCCAFVGDAAVAGMAGQGFLFVHEGFSPRYLKVGGRWRDHERWAIRADAGAAVGR